METTEILYATEYIFPPPIFLASAPKLLKEKDQNFSPVDIADQENNPGLLGVAIKSDTAMLTAGAIVKEQEKEEEIMGGPSADLLCVVDTPDAPNEVGNEESGATGGEDAGNGADGNNKPIQKKERNAAGSHEGIARIVRGDRNGFINLSGQWLIEPVERRILAFSEKFAVYEESGHFGFLNDSGEEITPAIYSNCADFSEGFTAVQQNNKWGFIDSNGVQVIPFEYDAVRNFSEGFAVVMKQGKVGFIDQENKMIIKPIFEAVYDFNNRFAIYQEKQKLGFIDHEGKVIIKAKYDRANHFVHPEEDNPLIRIN